MDHEQLTTPIELAEFLSIPVATLYSWRYQGYCPPGIRIGRHVRYRPGDVDEWLVELLGTPR